MEFSARQHDSQVVRDIVRAHETCILPNHRNTLTNRFTNNNIHATARVKRANHRDEAAEKLDDLSQQVAHFREVRDAAAKHIRDIQIEKKQVSGGKNRKLRTNGRGKRAPAIKVDQEAKENQPLFIGSSAPVPLDPELEPPPPVASFQWGSGSTPVDAAAFPPSTCPRGFAPSDFFTNAAPLGSQASFFAAYMR
ncbi:MAG TPA: hypothetical protein VGO47_10415 [Chlamydiales bacterium]|nr:hypothetical protein [Chlamydiales bacterium]